MSYCTTQETIFNILFNGKESEKEDIHIYMNHIAVLFKLTQHCKPTTIQKKKKLHRKKGQAVKVCLS